MRGYCAAGSFWLLILLNLVALTAQSALMPLGDTITLAAVPLGRSRLRADPPVGLGELYLRLDRKRCGTRIGPRESGCCRWCSAPRCSCCSLPVYPVDPPSWRVRARIAGIGAVARDPRFWIFVLAASALQASHQVYYGFGTLYWRSLGFSDTTIGWLWAEGVLAEILLFWQGRRLLARLGPIGLMVLGGIAGILRWSLAGALTWLPFIAALQLLHAFTFGASHLGAMHYLSRAVPPSAAASAQSLYAALSSGLGSGLVMGIAGALYSAFGGGAYSFMAVLSAAGSGRSSGIRLGNRSTEPPALLTRLRDKRDIGTVRRGVVSPQPPCRPIIGSRRSAMPVPPQPAWRPFSMAYLHPPRGRAQATSNTSDGRRPPHGRPRNREIL